MKNPMYLLLWVCSAVGLVLAYYKSLGRQWVPAVFLFVISVGVILASAWLLQFVNRLIVPIEADQSIGATTSQNGPLIMEKSEKTIREPLLWAVCLLIGAIALVQFPDLLWKWWLAYPAAFLMTILVGVILVMVMGQKFERIVADSNGVEVRTEARVVSKTDKKVAWRDVGAVKMVDIYIKATMTQYERNRVDRFDRRVLALFDHEGKELLSLDDPLAPDRTYKRFLESIPVWTNLTIQKDRVTR